MMKVLQFDKFGRFITSFGSKEEAKAITGNRWLYRNLYREISYTGGSIFVFENDERINYNPNTKTITLNCVDFVGVYDPQYNIKKELSDYTPERIDPAECSDKAELVPYIKQVEKKFDNIPLRIECWCKGVKIGVFDNVAEARRITGAACIWSNMFGECATTKGLIFRRERKPEEIMEKLI